MTVATNWFRQTRRTYFGNAAAQRDFRVQLRGTRSVMLFGIYLAVLIGVGFFKYLDIANNGMISVVQAQRELRDFYAIVVALLGGMVSIVTPGLAATAIVSERQRRSLDLVFSAPVAPRYYLVGKMIAVYRYIWMLLILSLPITAACVVLGGASWSDVLSIYFGLSMHGLLFAAIGLLVSTLSARPISAVVWTYVAVGSYLAATGSFAAASYSSYAWEMASERPFFVGLNPFSVVFAAGTHTTLAGIAVPNFILAAAAILVAIRLCLLGAGSVLSEGRETANLRIHWAVFTAAVAFGLTYWLAASNAYAEMARSSVAIEQRVDISAVALGYGLFWLMAPLAIVLPTLASYGTDGALRQRVNGSFGVRRTFDGTPAGSLPYLALIVGLATLFGLGGIAAAGARLPSIAFLPYVVYTFGFWSLFWAIGRVASSYGMGLRAARTTVVAAFVVLALLPAPFLAGFAPGTFNLAGPSPWDLYLLRPVLQFDHVNLAMPTVYGLSLIGCALGLNAWSERNRFLVGGHAKAL